MRGLSALRKRAKSIRGGYVGGDDGDGRADTIDVGRGDVTKDGSRFPWVRALYHIAA